MSAMTADKRDIVERLLGPGGLSKANCREAAAEIKWLRAALADHETALTALKPAAPSADQRDKSTDWRAERKLSENQYCWLCDLGDEMVAEIERLRAALTALEKRTMKRGMDVTSNG